MPRAEKSSSVISSAKGHRYLPRLQRQTWPAVKRALLCTSTSRRFAQRASCVTCCGGRRVSSGSGMPLRVSFSVGMEQLLILYMAALHANCVTSVTIRALSGRTRVQQYCAWGHCSQGHVAHCCSLSSCSMRCFDLKAARLDLPGWRGQPSRRGQFQDVTFHSRVAQLHDGEPKI